MLHHDACLNDRHAGTLGSKGQNVAFLENRLEAASRFVGCDEACNGVH